MLKEAGLTAGVEPTPTKRALRRLLQPETHRGVAPQLLAAFNQSCFGCVLHTCRCAVVLVGGLMPIILLQPPLGVRMGWERCVSELAEAARCSAMQYRCGKEEGRYHCAKLAHA